MRPLLVEKCWPCHGNAEKPKGGLRLTSRPSILKGGDSGPAAVAGDPAGSLLIQADPLRARAEDAAQGQAARTARSTSCRAGSRWGFPGPRRRRRRRPTRPRAAGPRSPMHQRRFWSFQPVKAVAVPAVRDTARARSAIDRFLLADLEKNGLAPAAPADRRTLIRRATFDLIGLPPTPEEIDAFLADRLAPGVRTRRRSPAGLAAIRRALGPALARRRPLRRRARPDPVARRERFPRSLAIPRLGRRRFQPRPAVHGVHPVPGRRRPAAAAAARRDQQGRAGRHRACSPSPTSCPATSTRTR